ncbi:MAG: DUF4430 domain-containing protein [Chloroflexi bacterium]|nr:DUF4430 domain-containing protein [Chloroflexota bacterium]
MIHQIRKLDLVPVLLLLILVPLALPPAVTAWTTYPLSPADAEITNALSYLAAEQEADGGIGDAAQSTWATMAIAAAGQDPNTWKSGGTSIVDYLAAHAGSASSATDYARMILAATSADKDPRNFGGRDFVALLEGTYDGTQIGSATALNDDAWGIMALISAGKPTSDAMITNSAAFIKANQNTDGGWGWAVGQSSDADSTAASIMGLSAAGESQSSTAIQNALAYLKTQQTASGGFDSWGSTNADTDAWCVSAIVATGGNPSGTAWESATGNTPIDDLVSFQAANGSFEWQSGNPGFSPVKTTACAIIALAGKAYPVKIISAPPPPPTGVTITVRIEGKTGTVWSGQVTVTDSTIVDDQGGSHYFAIPTALGALDKASKTGAFPYTVGDFGWGLAITKINGIGDWANGPWWLYRVNGVSAQVGAGGFELNVTTPPSPPHTEVLFYETTAFSELPLKLALSKTAVSINEAVTATVTYYDDIAGQWLPIGGASVHADKDYTTGADGTVSITVGHDATIEVYAEKTGYVRSNKITLTVGTGGGPTDQTGTITLKATIIPAIAISVDKSEIDFGGNLGPRDTGGPIPVTITNEGAWNVRVTAQVTDAASNLFVNGLYLDGALWRSFGQTILRNGNHGAQVTLHVPESYAGVGAKSGSIIFWAEEG